MSCDLFGLSVAEVPSVHIKGNTYSVLSEVKITSNVSRSGEMRQGAQVPPVRGGRV